MQHRVLQLVLCCKDGRLFVCDVLHSHLLCELVKPTVDESALGQPLQPRAFVTADGGRAVFAVGTMMFST